VPHDDPRSNFHLAAQSLLVPAGIDGTHVFPVPTSLATPADCAAGYEATLRSFFSDQGGTAFPRFDLILLGLGDDGHTASLFPGKPSIGERRAWVTWSPPGVLPPPVNRVTFTLPVLNSAREAMFLAGGAGKAKIISEVFGPAGDSGKYPSGLVQPDEGQLTWLLDEAAASQLPNE
jgi:6-phosphogluconolactonase